MRKHAKGRGKEKETPRETRQQPEEHLQQQSKDTQSCPAISPIAPSSSRSPSSPESEGGGGPSGGGVVSSLHEDDPLPSTSKEQTKVCRSNLLKIHLKWFSPIRRKN